MTALGRVLPQSHALSAQYLPQYTRLDTARDTTVRASTLDDVATQAPRLQRLQEALNPQTYALIDAMLGSAQAGLDRGGALSPEELREAQQQARAAYSTRGLALGQPAAVAELLNSESRRRQRLAEDRAFATQAAGLGHATRAQAIPGVLGISGQGYGEQAYALSNPASVLGYASDTFNTNYNAAASRANAAANRTAALWGAGIEALGKVDWSQFGRN